MSKRSFDSEIFDFANKEIGVSKRSFDSKISDFARNGRLRSAFADSQNFVSTLLRTMQKIDIRFMPGKASQIRNIGVSKLCFDSKSRAFALHSICGFLGSFDPLHRGHEWIVDKLLEQFDVVLLLIPAFHFEKTVRFPLNATFEQRLEMLATFSKRKGERIAVGLTHEVLFIRLADCLSQHFPSTEIAFGMGNETFEKVLASKTYYARMGLPWTAEEEAKLEQLQKRIMVFGRSSNNSRFISVPENLRQLSSTRVRETVMELRKTSAPEAIWQERLENMISPEVFRFILQQKLYSCCPLKQ